MCLRNKELPGDIHVIFKLNTNPYCDGKPIMLSDVANGLKLGVLAASGRSGQLAQPTVLTAAKKEASAVAGGYLLWDGSGQRVVFNLQQQLQSSPSAARPRPSPSAWRPLCYGDRVRLVAHSAYHPSGVVGVYRKHGLVGMGPCDASDPEEFTESEFVIAASRRAAVGEPVRYSAAIALVDVAHGGQLWNNKQADTWRAGYVCLRPIATNSVAPPARVAALVACSVQALAGDPEGLVPGQMHVSLLPADPAQQGEPVPAGAAGVAVLVEDSHRASSKFNCRLAAYRKPNSALRGGYLYSLPASHAQPVTFTLERLDAPGLAPGHGAANPASPGIGQGGSGSGVGLAQPRQRSTSCVLLPHAADAPARRHAHPPLRMPAPPALRERAALLATVLALVLLAIAAVRAASPVGQWYLALALGAVSMRLFLAATQPARPRRGELLVADPNPAGFLPAPAVAVADSVDDSDDSEVPEDSSAGPAPASPSSMPSSMEVPEDGPPRGSAAEGADGEWERDPEGCTVPARYVNAEKGDQVKARARFLKTMRWRKANGLADILARPHPLFRVIKKHTNQFFYGRGREGPVVYYETPKAADLPALSRLGVGVEDLVYHFVYISEFLYQRLDAAPDAQCISVVDCSGIGVADFGGAVVDFLKKVSAVTQQHYPERSFSIVCINAPFSFRMVWALVGALMDPVTRAKTHIYGSNYVPKMAPYIAPEEVPAQFRKPAKGEPAPEPYHAGIAAAGPALPEGALPAAWAGAESEVLPLGPDEEAMFRLVDRVNARWAAQHPGEELPRGRLVDPEGAEGKEGK